MKRLVSIIALATLTVANAFAQQPSREQLEAMIAQMPQIPGSRKVVTGKLDNGLTYYVRHNALPEHRAEFYLATNVGAIQEEYPSQDGLAHFLEHMCFNGTENFPDKGILNYLRSIGAEFGRNINASTGFEETQYMLNNIPVERESVVDSCLMILRDYSHYVINDPAEIDKERGVIIEERRTRRDAGWRNMERSLPYFFGEGFIADHTLIGRQEHLETFKPEALVEFYRTWYNPCNQAVVVVGDIDVNRTVEKIKELFGPIPAKENQKPKEIVSIKNHGTPRVGIITDPEGSTPSIDVVWHSPAMPEGINSTISGMALSVIKTIAENVMAERYNDITSKAGSSFLGGGLSFTELIYEDIDAVFLSSTLKEDNILGGFADVYTEFLRMVRYGITQKEFDRTKKDILSYLETQVKKADTRHNPQLVRPILNWFFDNKPVLEPADELKTYEMIFENITADSVNDFLKSQGGSNNLVVIYTGQEKEGIATPTADQILEVMSRVEKSDIQAPKGENVPESFLNPAKLKGSPVVNEQAGIYGSTEWTLANGVKVVVYPTDLQKDQIVFDLSKDGGLSLIEDKDTPSFESTLQEFYHQNAGVAGFPGTIVTKMLSGKNLSVDSYVNDLSHGVSGNSTVKDLETALQLVYLKYAKPRFDKEEWNNSVLMLRSVLPGAESRPDFIFSKEITKTLYGDNPRRETVSKDLLKKASLKVYKNNIRKLYKDAAGATMFIVGDVDTAALKPLVEKYIGSLPAGRKAPGWKDRKVRIREGKVENVFRQDMQTPKSSVLQVYSARTPFTFEKEAALDAISYILDMRYTESLREEEGGTYGAQAFTSISRRPVEQIIVNVYFDCRPSMADKLRSLAVNGLEDLAKNGPTDEELQMARLNLQKNIPENRQSNRYWRRAIEYYYTYGDDMDKSKEKAIEAISKELIQSTLTELLSQDNRIEVVMMPAETVESE